MAKSDGVVEPGRKKKKEARAAAGTRFVGVRQLVSGKFSARLAGHHLGCFPTAEEASMAYDERALQLNGPAARTNFKKEGGGHGFVGVQLRPSGKFAAHIWSGGKKEWLGAYDTAEQAARAYDEAAVRVRGAKAKLNFEPVVSPEGRQEDGPSSVTRVSDRPGVAMVAAAAEDSSTSMLNNFPEPRQLSIFTEADISHVRVAFPVEEFMPVEDFINDIN